MSRQWFDCRLLTLNIIYTFHIILMAAVIFSIINASTIKAKSAQAMEHTDNKCRSTVNSNITESAEQTNICCSSVKANITEALEQTDICRSSVKANITQTLEQTNNKCRPTLNSKITEVYKHACG